MVTEKFRGCRDLMVLRVVPQALSRLLEMLLVVEIVGGPFSLFRG